MSSRTKQLAKKLGILSKENVTFNAKRNRKDQVFSYIVIIDFEATCWEERRRGQTQEIIEFPAVLLSLSTGEIEREFHQYVQPQECPILSVFCTELTGITQDKVDGGVPLGVCLKLFSQWVCDLEKEKGIVLANPQVAHENKQTSNQQTKLAAIATWTDWDLSVCLHYECLRKHIKKLAFFNLWIDLKVTYKQFYDRKPMGLNGALEDLGLNFKGREHSGIDDARNTAKLCYRLVCDGCQLKITKCLEKSQIFQTTLRPPSNVPALVRSPHQTCLLSSKQEVTDSSKENSCCDKDSVLPQEEQNDSLNSSGDSAFLNGISAQLDFSSEGLDTPLPNKGDNPLEPFKKPTIVPAKRTPNFKEHSNSLLNCGSCGGRQCKHAFLSREAYSISSLCSNPSHPSSFKSTAAPSKTEKRALLQSSSLTIQSPLSATLSRGQVFQPPSFGTVTPPTTHGGPLVGGPSVKVTPPMCHCGKRTKQKMVTSPGPNEGRMFFSCGHRQGCGYFKWQSQLLEIVNRPSLHSEYEA